VTVGPDLGEEIGHIIPGGAGGELAENIAEIRPAANVWLVHSLRDLKPLAELLRPAPVKLLPAIPVSTFVNSPTNETPRCVQPIDVT
jgi:hypothetical protein